ncbi:NADH dehydrogenase [ubiquinone] 1 beta subcomplex subunit 5, mitochondrial-like [Liolophura sinensis]|uniref:NADH dehydrogenase [ubiquinone] 1 beta subcomplex subunit 5, mitochondrial-like n=1 Tax=Liolophura sinensis TaxID=3198878 RepID=UPI003158C23B
MVVLSVLRQSASRNIRSFGATGSVLKPVAKNNVVQLALSRGMAEVRKMVPKPSRFEWDVFKDEFHLYFMIGVLPLAAIIFYANVFIGQAELADIPEGYEPEHWEYHKHPIKRWFARYVYDKPEKDYERYMHALYVANETRKNRLLEWKVKDLMGRRQDYRGWYWVPIDASRVETASKNKELYKDTVGTN